MTTEEALVRLAESTAEAVAGVLRMYVPDAVDVGGVTVAVGSEPLRSFPLPCVAASVTYSDGVDGRQRLRDHDEGRPAACRRDDGHGAGPGHGRGRARASSSCRR